MSSADFFNRWKALGLPAQESQKIYPARQPMETENIKTKLAGLGSRLLTDVDPNPENYVCAGILHTQSQQIGALIRLEPNKQAKVFVCLSIDILQMYRLTVRSSKDTASKTLCDLISQQF